MKLFYTGPLLNAELLAAMLERHGIAAARQFVDPTSPEDGDLNRPARPFVPDADYDRVYRRFYPGRGDEL